MPVTKENLDSVFTYHAPTPEDVVAYEKIRSAAKALAGTILDVAPACADQQASIRLLRESVMTANAAIALKGGV